MATLWAVGGYLIGLALEMTFFPDTPIRIILVSVNVLLGLLLLKGITRDPTAERLFYEGPRPDEEGSPAIGCLWLLPVSLLFVGVLLWLWAVILRLILK